MRRREFITLLSGATAWPLVARAQQGERMRQVGMLLSGTADDAVFQTWVGAFLQGIMGRNVRIETRWAGHSQVRAGIGRTRARRDRGAWRFDSEAVAAVDP